jgi:hypothetical protein
MYAVITNYKKKDSMSERKLFDVSDPIRNAPKWKFWDKSYHVIVKCNNDGCDFVKHINNSYPSATIGWGMLTMHKLAMALHASECEFAPKEKKPKKKATKKAAKKPVKKAAKKK